MHQVPDILRRVRAAAERRVLYLPHAIRQMCRPDRMITAKEVRAVIDGGQVIEDYPADPRGAACFWATEKAAGRSM